MRINFTELSDADLSALIVAAMQEWAARQDTPQATVIERKPPPAPKIMTIAEPPEDEKEFALRIKAMMQQGEYIKASERRAVAEIAEQYPAWVRRQGLPTESGTAAWRDATRAMSRYRPAKER